MIKPLPKAHIQRHIEMLEASKVRAHLKTTANKQGYGP